MSQTDTQKTERKEESNQSLSKKSTDFERVIGLEVLSFDSVELTKNKVGKNTFMEVGTLRVVYFQEFDRFLLDLGDWEYALLKRIPVTCSSRTDKESRTYTFPTYSGYYVLKISKIIHPEALQNFETILSNASKFSYLEEDVPIRQNELSPDVGLMERSEEDKNTAPKRDKVEEEQTKLHGKEKIKRSFAKFIDKLSGSHAKKVAENNLFLTQIMEFNAMKDMKVNFAPHLNFGRKEVKNDFFLFNNTVRLSWL